MEESMTSIDKIASHHEHRIFPKRFILKVNGSKVITCPRFKICRGPTYNSGYKEYLCSRNHLECPTENPDVCIHEKYAKLGYRARVYSGIKEDPDYA